MLQAMARKVHAMQQGAHDNTMRQEGAAAAFAAVGKRLDALAEQSKTPGSVGVEQVHSLLSNMQQAAVQQMTQQSGRALQAGDVLEMCRALSSPPEGGHAKDA